jgi:hypothetical protein
MNTARQFTLARRCLLSGLLAAWVALLLACGGAGNKSGSKDGKQAQGKDDKTAKKDNAKEVPGQDAKSRWVAMGSPSLNFTNLKAGDLGVMPVGEWMEFGEKRTRPTGWKVLQIIDRENAILTHIDGFYKEVNGEAFWFEMDTSGMVDGRSHTFDGIWECKGTRRYNAALGGTRTVFVLRYCGKQ